MAAIATSDCWGDHARRAARRHGGALLLRPMVGASARGGCLARCAH